MLFIDKLFKHMCSRNGTTLRAIPQLPAASVKQQGTLRDRKSHHDEHDARPTKQSVLTSS